MFENGSHDDKQESRKSLNLKDSRESDFAMNHLKAENKELKENFGKLKENYCDLKKKLNINYVQIDEKEYDNIKENILEKENENQKLKEKVKI